VLKKLGHLSLPATLPFAGVEPFPAGTMRYQSRISAQLLIEQARADLSGEPECFKTFLLALCCGLRRAEIDGLQWSMIDFDKGVIALLETDYLHLKTPASADAISIDPEVANLLRSMMPATKGAFVVQSSRPPSNDKSYARYRCEPVFKRLIHWLRGKGVTAKKPVHEMRKELGAVIATAAGIYAASKMLRHADIGITSRHYSDLKCRVVSGLGRFLTPESTGGERATSRIM